MNMRVDRRRLEEEEVPKKSFEEILLEAVDDALASLGESARESVYFHLNEKFNMPRSDIPYHYEDFAQGLEKIFGIGARFLEILVMKNLHKGLGQPLKWDDDKQFVFVDYIATAKQNYSKSRKSANS
jgi:hypothetical protein